jgi:hypothetical protein
MRLKEANNLDSFVIYVDIAKLSPSSSPRRAKFTSFTINLCYMYLYINNFTLNPNQTYNMKFVFHPKKNILLNFLQAALCFNQSLTQLCLNLCVYYTS